MKYKIQLITGSTGLRDAGIIETDKEPSWSDAGNYVFRDKEGKITHAYPISKTVITVIKD